MNTVSQNQSFVRFVYPFVFAPEQFAEIIKKTQNAEFAADSEKSFPVWQSASFPKADMMPHVSRYLNPSAADSHPTVRIWNLSGEALTSFHGLGSRAEWKLHAKQTTENKESRNIEIFFSFEKIHLTLFRTGIGFMTFETVPRSSQSDDWLNFIHFFRFINRKSVSLSASRVVEFDEITRRKTHLPFFPFQEVKQKKSGNLKEIICHLLKQSGVVCEDVFIPDKLIPYTVFFIENQPESDDFWFIYRLRNFFHSEQGKNPASDDFSPTHPSLLEYGSRQWHIFSLDGGTFLSCAAPNTEFFRVTLPEHLRSQYFLLFLLALQQRFALVNFSARIGESWFGQNDDRRIAAFGQIRDAFLDFAALGYFVQVMQREHHHRCYKRWQEIFQVEHFYQNVRHKIREIHEYLQMRRTEEIKNLTEKNTDLIKAQERQINILSVLLALLFGLPSLIIGFLGINLNRLTVKENEALEWWQAALFVGFPLLLGVILGLILFRRFTKTKK